MSENQFYPDYAILPGEILEFELDSLEMSQKDLSDKTGISKKHINHIIAGKAPITPETAILLERVLGKPAHYWLNLEALYQEAVARIADKEKLERYAEWAKQFPNSMLQKLGFIEKHNEITKKVDSLLRFFAIGSPDDYQTVWGNLQVQYRQDNRTKNCPYSSAAWLRAGEIEANKIHCQPYSEKEFKQALSEIRTLTRTTDPKIFIPKLKEICSSVGVAIVFVPCFPNTGISGATRWLSSDKAVIQLSLRYKTNDHLWFTFFHEAAHILLHGKKRIYLEFDGPNNNVEEENEANEFAQKQLIPRSVWGRLITQDQFTENIIKSIAEEIGIAEGIIVGQLQHHKHLAFSTLNHLKVRYTWQ
ncbi:HigA family addiction module antitoxin [uncultured Haemophilus sp.]|uniref:HigA family addiction module antitoxin n=1 Tax=uncultured Haemophilus sp. TaxID=237779 RepID=UPI002806194C|nr:HigA family addiction module antitoxin [uncultured Haemophilus sp.]